MLHSLLIISQNQSSREQEAIKLSDAAGIDHFDRTVVERAERSTKGDEPKLRASLGIDDVKQLQKTLYLKPLRGTTKAVIIHDAHLLTTEAQNALLKILEEPPEHTILILTAERKDALLPTILSRCSVIELAEEKPELSEAEKAMFRELLTTIPEWGVGKSLKEAERLAKNKDDALDWLEKLILVTREELLSLYLTNTKSIILNPDQIGGTDNEESHHKNLPLLLKKLQETHRTIKTTNTNLRLTLENLFL